MTFYRLAEEKDFLVEEQYVQFLLHHSTEIIEYIKEGKMFKAVKSLRERTGMSLKECKDLCDRYKNCMKAFEDFQNGIKIYTKY